MSRGTPEQVLQSIVEGINLGESRRAHALCMSLRPLLPLSPGASLAACQESVNPWAPLWP